MKLTKPTPVLTCGPLVRYVDRSSVVVWAEVREPLEVEVLLEADSSPTMPAAGLPVSQRAWTIRVEDSYYAWVAIGFLLPDTWYSYRIVGNRKNGTSIPLWPDSRLSGVALPSVFKTLPLWSLDTFRVAYGSCRKGYAVLDDKAPATGPDALEGLAHLLQQNFDRRDQAWPHVLQLMGDQIYADDFSGALARKFGHKLAADFTEFAQIYREAWTARSSVRWALSCIPSL